LVRGKRFQAGAWLAGAVCLKVFPAYLLLIPAVRRDGRCLFGFAVGMFVGLVVIPAAALGPRQAQRALEDFARVMLAPALGLGDDGSRSEELLQLNGTDNVSFQAVFHYWQHPDPLRRPSRPAPWTKRAHLLLAAGLTLATVLLAAAWRRRAGGVDLVLF